jgi:hypothetical protein
MDLQEALRELRLERASFIRDRVVVTGGATEASNTDRATYTIRHDDRTEDVTEDGVDAELA